MSFILIQIILVIIYKCNSLYNIRKYFFSITNKYISYLSFQNNNNFVTSNYINAFDIKEKKGKKLKEPPKRRPKLSNEEIEDLKRNNNKEKSYMKKRETNRDKSKRKTQQPYIIKEMNLEINYQNSPEINNNIKNTNNSRDIFTLNNISKNNSKRNKKLKSYFYKKDPKRALNEIPANSNEELDKNVL